MNMARLQPTELARYLQGVAGRRLIVVVNVLLVLWIAARLAMLTWTLLPGPETGPAVAATTQSTAAVRPDPDRELVARLPGWHLLGMPAREVAPVATAVPETAPDTQLRLTLRGALASDDRENARAIIADQGGREEQYAIGAMLPGNAELSEIYPDRVLLKRNGRYETLRLPEDRLSGGAPAPRVAARPAANNPAQRLRELRQSLQKNPGDLYGLVQPKPAHDEAGNLIGFAISPSGEPELFESFGLQDGDIVTQVGDVSLNDRASMMAALQQLNTSESVTLTLLRDGVEQQVQIGAR